MISPYSLRDNCAFFTMLKHATVLCMLCYLVVAESLVQSVKPTNVIGSSEQHTSFSFIKPGLTQTSFAFNGPSSHQSFTSSIGNPQLAQKVLPSLAQALAYRNPVLGYYPFDHTNNGIVPTFTATTTVPLAYQTMDPAMLTYAQQSQQQPYWHAHQLNAISQSQLAQLALRQAQLVQAQQSQLQTAIQSKQVNKELQLPQQNQQSEQPQSLLGIAYSSAPSVAHVEVSGNGYKFDF